jgi:SAM-dependent methyltransferase
LRVDEQEDIKRYWNAYYTRALDITAPSPFATYVTSLLDVSSVRVLLDVGCGNGRDSFFFQSMGFEVYATDGSEKAIEVVSEKTTFIQKKNTPKFFCHQFAKDRSVLDSIGLPPVDIVYSRFFIHAISLQVEQAFIAEMSKIAKTGARMFSEFRTPNDPLSKMGVAVGDNERVTDHYRRFVKAADHIERVCHAGWSLVNCIESNGLAVFGDEDPVVARVEFVKI